MFLKDENYRFLADTSNGAVTPDHHSFLNDKYHDIHEWKNEVRGLVHQGLCYAPASVAFNEEIVEEVDFGSYIRKKVYFDSAPGCRIPAYLLIPKSLPKPAPAMIVLHDHG